eukprot:scaffold42819_cov78-Cyclotella_meneghiniana.AAC.4
MSSQAQLGSQTPSSSSLTLRCALLLLLATLQPDPSLGRHGTISTVNAQTHQHQLHVVSSSSSSSRYCRSYFSSHGNQHERSFEPSLSDGSPFHSSIILSGAGNQTKRTLRRVIMV